MLKPEILDRLPIRPVTLFDLYEPYYPTGSAEICAGVTPNDYDWVVNGSGEGVAGAVEAYLLENGWIHAPHRDKYPDDRCVIFETHLSDPQYGRQAKVNIMLCTDELYYTKWVVATKLAKRLQLADRDDRVALFRVVCDDDTSWL